MRDVRAQVASARRATAQRMPADNPQIFRIVRRVEVRNDKACKAGIRMGDPVHAADLLPMVRENPGHGLAVSLPDAGIIAMSEAPVGGVERSNVAQLRRFPQRLALFRLPALLEIEDTRQR